MSNLSKTQLSFEFLTFSQKNFVELFNGLSSRDKNNLKNSQCGVELNNMFEFLCNVLGKKVVEEKKSRKSKPKLTENNDEQDLNTHQESNNEKSTTLENVKTNVEEKNTKPEKKTQNKKKKLNKDENPQDKVVQSNEKLEQEKKNVSKKKETQNVSSNNE
jgi:hypothetical protein